MYATPFSRAPHPCVAGGCGHPAEHHVPTPELAGAREKVVFCSECRRHEVRRERR